MASSVSHSTIKRYIAGIRSHLIDLDISAEVSTLRIQRILRGIRSVHGTKPVKQAAPILLPTLKLMNAKLLKHADQTGSDADLVYATCFAVAFGVFARMGELTHQVFDPRIHLTKGDVDIERATIRIKVSKTDQYGHTVLLPLPDPEDQQVSPLALLRRLLSSPRLADASDDAPLFALGNSHDKPFRREEVLKRIREVTPKVPKAFSGHSFRRGSATWAFSVGMNDIQIKVLGRWKVHVESYARYIDNGAQQLEWQRKLANELYSRPSSFETRRPYPSADLAWVPPNATLNQMLALA